jgi:tryptophanyl-tRNA synthetase
MEIVVSGIRPTGNLHLGNYFGAIKNFIKMQEENNCYFFIADYHSLTTHRLLTYPTLMAADVIIHKAAKVPVGKDQEQNLEMMRTFAKRFNRIYKTEYFPIPTAYNFGEALVKIPGLDGSGKMGKSEGEGNAIFFADKPEVIRKKVMKAVTDSGPTEMNQNKSEPIENLFTLLKVVSTPDTVTHFNDLYNKCEIRYGDLKPL